MPDFESLPFFERPDLTPYLVHLTKNTVAEDDCTAFDNLVHILKTGRIFPSDSTKGFIKGPNPATCFMDVPFASLKYVLNPQNTKGPNPRYEPYGIIVTKGHAYGKGCRPVLYLSNDEIAELGIEAEHLWRVVRFEVKNDNWISWLHEREWRCEGGFKLPTRFKAALVRDSLEAKRLENMIRRNPEKFKARPSSIIPLDIICQGLPKL